MKFRLPLGLLALASCFALPSPAEAFTYIQRLGCPGDTGAAWAEEDLPNQWSMHRGGYSGLSDLETKEILERSIGVWGEAWGNPCCSGFSHRFMGPTSSTPIESEGENVVGFAEQNWPRFLGSPWAVIAVTLPQFDPRSCRLREADMLFNAVTFEFRTDGELADPAAVDFETIAVHEFGHWIGLDHSIDPTSPTGFLSESVMFPSYRGGTGDRALYLDDMLGACALYPSSCGDCREDRDCPDGQACQNGACNGITCEDSWSCPMGSVCGEDGICHRGCRLHAECAPNFFCADGACLPRVDCTACQSCRRSSDCGGGDYFCLEFDDDVRRCTKRCGSDAECDGDSRCHIVQGGFGFCGSPDPEAFCPGGYVCSSAACPSLGEPCGSCGERADICVSTLGGPVCSCTCSLDSDCDGGRCLRDPATGQPACFPRTTTSACGGTHCPPGSTCEEGVCLARCGNQLCAADEICEGGACASLCPSCPLGEVCDPLRRSCVIEPSCLGVVCEEGERCVDGDCHTACGAGVCASGERCQGGRCVKAGASSSSGGCSAGGEAPATIALLLAGFMLASRARRRSP